MAYNRMTDGDFCFEVKIGKMEYHIRITAGDTVLSGIWQSNKMRFDREESEDIKMAKKQTAGRDRLGTLAPKFAELNDDVLFGEVWSREEQLSARDRSMITIAALFSAGLYPQLNSGGFLFGSICRIGFKIIDISTICVI